MVAGIWRDGRWVLFRRAIISAAMLLMALTPLMSLIVWHGFNRQLPNDDAANFLETAAKIYRKSLDEGVLSIGMNAYLVRGWRPISFPVSAVPFLFLFHSGLHRAVAATQIAWFLVLSVYVYLLLRRYLSKTAAIIGYALLVTVPWVAQYSRLLFYSEIAVVTASAAVAYHYIRSKQWSDIGHSVASGAWLGLALTIRPAEAVTSCLLPLSLLVFWAWHTGRLRLRDVIAAAAVGIVVAGLLLARIDSASMSRSLSLGLLLAVLMAYAAGLVYFRNRANGAFGAFVLLTLLIVGVWWMPYMRELYDWVHTASPFGRMGKLYPTMSNLNAWESLLRIGQELGGVQWIAMSAVAGLMAAIAIFKRSFRFCGLGLVLAGGFVLLLVTGLTAVAGDLDTRRAFIGAFAFQSGLFLLAVSPGIPLASLRVFLLGTLSVIQLILAFHSSFPNAGNASFPDAGNPSEARLKRIRSYPTPALSDPSELTFAKVKDRLTSPAQIATFSLAMNHPERRVFDPAALQALAAAYRSPLGFGYPWDFDRVEEGYSQLDQFGYGAILLDVDFDDPASSLNTPYEKLTLDLLKRFREGNLSAIGWDPAGIVDVGGRRLAFLYRSLGVPRGANLALSSNGGVAGASASQAGFPPGNINDGLVTAWGSPEGKEDVYAYVTLPAPVLRPILVIVLFSPGGRAHLRDIRVAATNGPVDGKPSWTQLKIRLDKSQPFTNRVTVPEGKDASMVSLEIDPADRATKSYRTYAIVCLRGSGEDKPNYLPVGTGVYFRELQIIR